MRVLNVIENGYRATLEEQDDTIVWLTHALAGAGGRVDVLLMGDAVSYAGPGQDASGLAFGDWRQTAPPRLADDLAKLLAKDVSVYAVAEDARALGLPTAGLLDGVALIPRAEVAVLFDRYDRIWKW